jgi:hypothetical protein
VATCARTRGAAGAAQAACAAAPRFCIRQHTSAYVSMRRHTLACVSIRQHTSAHVSIRQRASACVSIRQHTSAHVSVRQHTCAAAPEPLDAVGWDLELERMLVFVVARVPVSGRWLLLVSSFTCFTCFTSTRGGGISSLNGCSYSYLAGTLSFSISSKLGTESVVN